MISFNKSVHQPSLPSSFLNLSPILVYVLFGAASQQFSSSCSHTQHQTFFFNLPSLILWFPKEPTPPSSSSSLASTTTTTPRPFVPLSPNTRLYYYYSSLVPLFCRFCSHQLLPHPKWKRSSEFGMDGMGGSRSPIYYVYGVGIR